MLAKIGAQVYGYDVRMVVELCVKKCRNVQPGLMQQKPADIKSAGLYASESK